MSRKPPTPKATSAGTALWTYNLRILLGNSYWLIITPLVVTHLVLFWTMATATLVPASRAMLTIELLAPILGAFLCAHVLAPEQDGVGELVFARPLSLERILVRRLLVIFIFTAAVLTPTFLVYELTVAKFPLLLAALVTIPSLLFLSVMAMLVASATRHPLLGLAAAGSFWALDLLVGSYFNPLVSLHSYADRLAERPMSEQWIVSKVILVVLALLLYLWSRRVLGRPPSPRRWASVLLSSFLVILLLVTYVASGAAYKVAYGLRHEQSTAARARLWYQQQFSGYGPIPVAWMFGPAFVLYVQAELAGDAPFAGRGGASLLSPVDLQRMNLLLERYPDSIWADNAQFEIATAAARRPLEPPWLVISRRADNPESERKLIADDLPRAVQEYQKLADRYPESSFVPLALSRQAETGLAMLDFDLARAAYQRLLETHPGSPEAYQAGVSLSALYLREGKAEAAFEAANAAAEVGPWDICAEAFLAAAISARQMGDPDLARARYRRALSAAQEAIARAIKEEERPSGLPKDEHLRRCDAVVKACREAIASDLRPQPVPDSNLTRVSGRVLVRGAGKKGVRVALGVSPTPDGFPSPFQEGPAFSTASDDSGAYHFESLPAGRYAVVAIAIEGVWDAPRLTLGEVPLPLQVGPNPTTLPDLSLHLAAPAPAPGVASPPRGGVPSPPTEGGDQRRGRRPGQGRQGRGTQRGR